MTRVPLLAGLAAVALVSCGGQQGPTSAPVSLTSAAGPSHRTLGVGVGYAHSEAGALAAAVNYAEAAATPVFPVDDASEKQRVAAYATSSEQASLLDQRLRSIQGYESSYGVVSAHAKGLQAGAHLYPLTVKLGTYTDATAGVSIWAMLVEYSPNAYRGLYVTESVALRWEAGDWKFVPSQTSVALGPVPEILQGATTSQPPDQVNWQPWGR
jgi:hypothetical protein